MMQESKYVFTANFVEPRQNTEKTRVVTMTDSQSRKSKYQYMNAICQSENMKR